MNFILVLTDNLNMLQIQNWLFHDWKALHNFGKVLQDSHIQRMLPLRGFLVMGVMPFLQRFRRYAAFW